MYTLGYIKDAMATLFFIVFIILILQYDIHKKKNFIISCLVIAIIIDGTFTLYPFLHNYPIKL